VNCPQDFAPADLVIIARPPEEYLPQGSLLSSGARQKRQVDLDELRRRKIAMYAGRPEIRALPSASDAPSAGRLPALELPPAPGLPSASSSSGPSSLRASPQAWGSSCALLSPSTLTERRPA